MNKAFITLCPNDVESEIQLPLNTLDKLQIDKSRLGKNAKEKLDHNIFAVARSNANVKSLIIKLANRGFFLVEHKGGVSTFERFTTAHLFKKNLTNIDFPVHTHNGLYYTLEEPNIKTASPNLLIVFSSVADFSLNASISRRNFFTNFKTIGKYIPSNTYILRISDIGGVVGSFYLNNNFNSQIENDIQDLILKVLSDTNVKRNNVVLYGVSKGGTGALFHGIKGGYKSVSVDPIVTDEYHEKKFNDPHFTQGTFPTSKQEKFTELFKNSEIRRNTNIIYSENSPLYKHINTIVRAGDISNKITFINSANPKINDHPDVGPNTINLLTLILNNLFYELGNISSKTVPV